jgi:uncharacterized RDD family membrane protein YckC
LNFPVPSKDFTAPSLLRRMGCWFYEGILLFGVIFITDYLFSALTQTRHALENRWWQQFFIFVILGVYFVYFWSKGQTLAMKTWHIKVVDRQGQPISQLRALARYTLSWLWFLPPLAALSPFTLTGPEIALLMSGWVVVWALLSRFHPQRQYLHDVWAGTRLIDARQPAT